MSEQENSENNNQHPPPSPQIPIFANLSLIPRPSSPRDLKESKLKRSKYYYRDGSAVFLAGNTLFKFQASLIAADPDVQSYEFEHLTKDLINRLDADIDRPGSSDANPIVLPPDITAGLFERFLLVQFGGVTNISMLNLIQTLETPSCYTTTLAGHLIRLGYLGCRLGLRTLDTWFQMHISKILKELADKLPVQDDWDSRSMVQLMLYMQKTGVLKYRWNILSAARLTISKAITMAYPGIGKAPQGNMVNACAALYEERSLRLHNPGLFGFVFIVILSLGHKSPVWEDQLTREDRRVLYAAAMIFTCLSNHADLGISWLLNPTEIKHVCNRCSNNFDSCWNATFSRLKGLKSHVQLEDIRCIVGIPFYLSRFLVAFASKSTFCDCANKVEALAMKSTDKLYQCFAEKYNLLVQWV
ncbi:unnamed protein product [Rhizoctonia solani]|uniref:Uncharacterized protein n=1 Tax=Rhizoctonia solani TaxID=456999 RepID=A0A8H2Y312_9AGAM|nr:unnamed protein product [Rhizoctonia solani]